MKKRLLSTILIIGALVLITGPLLAAENTLKKATFAGGCFWCMESDFEKVPGVKDVISGYMGGKGKDPTYETYVKKGHIEVVQITYDPSLISYPQLLEIYWHKIDPTDAEGQFCDRGHAYTTAIFYHNEEQKRMAEESKEALSKSGKLQKPIATKILKADIFYPAENYHQGYYHKNPVRYKFYRFKCGRDKRLHELWGPHETYQRPDKGKIKDMLSNTQYRVTQDAGTEPPFKNEYWNNKKEGIYVDIVSGEPLFTSQDKFKSGTGWPSFTKPIEPKNINQITDTSHGMKRVEVKSAIGDSHLGHVFDDGPQPTGLRYCINSASLRFIPKEKLKEEGYEKYLKLFQR